MTTLAEYRNQTGETQAAFAMRAGVSQRTVSSAENGTLNITFDVMKKIVKATGFKVTAQALFNAYVGNEFYATGTTCGAARAAVTNRL